MASGPIPGRVPMGARGQRLAATVEQGTRTFRLEACKVQWEVTPGRQVEAWTWNGTVPGPEIRVTEGEQVRIVVTNRLDEPTTFRPHGLKVPNRMDGVPGAGGAEMILPTLTYEFGAVPAGTHWYHSHFNSAAQVARGLYGALIVEPRQPESVRYDRDCTIMIGDTGELGFTLNGRGFPATEVLQVREGERVRLRSHRGDGSSHAPAWPHHDGGPE